MPATKNGGGDQLARGASRVQFRPAGELVTEKQWDDIFADFDPKKFQDTTAKKVEGEKETTTTGIVRK
jgi:hypothetical protein